jgi:ribosomal protein S27E
MNLSLPAAVLGIVAGFLAGFLLGWFSRSRRSIRCHDCGKVLDLFNSHWSSGWLCNDCADAAAGAKGE